MTYGEKIAHYCLAGIISAVIVIVSVYIIAALVQYEKPITYVPQCEFRPCK